MLLWKTTDRFDGNNQAPHVYNRRTLHLHHDENTSANDEADSDCRRGSSARTPDNFGLDIESDSRSKTDSGGSGGGGEAFGLWHVTCSGVAQRSVICDEQHELLATRVPQPLPPSWPQSAWIQKWLLPAMRPLTHHC